MMRTLPESRLHRVTVTQSELHHQGSRVVERNQIPGAKSASAGLSRA